MDFKIYTKTGDDGTTGLVGGSRVRKSALRLDAYGTVDELNSWVGLVCALSEDQEVKDLLLRVQHNLFIMASKLASDEKGAAITGQLVVTPEEITLLEKAIDAYETALVPLNHFILPGGSPLVSYCHIARTVCRRAERNMVRLAESSEVDAALLHYINRLSDYLFVLARKLAADHGVAEIPWISGRK